MLEDTSKSEVIGRIIHMDTEITASKPLKIDTTFNTRDLNGKRKIWHRCAGFCFFLRNVFVEE